MALRMIGLAKHSPRRFAAGNDTCRFRIESERVLRLQFQRCTYRLRAGGLSTFASTQQRPRICSAAFSLADVFQTVMATFPANRVKGSGHRNPGRHQS